MSDPLNKRSRLSVAGNHWAGPVLSEGTCVWPTAEWPVLSGIVFNCSLSTWLLSTHSVPHCATGARDPVVKNASGCLPLWTGNSVLTVILAIEKSWARETELDGDGEEVSLVYGRWEDSTERAGTEGGSSAATWGTSRRQGSEAAGCPVGLRSTKQAAVQEWTKGRGQGNDDGRKINLGDTPRDVNCLERWLRIF